VLYSEKGRGKERGLNMRRIKNKGVYIVKVNK
jgi:hypothetical protein